jgi:predicted nicotinamide N-methyase
MKQALPGATLLVYPARVDGNQTSVPSATNIAVLLNQAGICKAIAADQPVLLKASLADPNELKALWNLAREFRDQVRAHPPAADYALYADYVFNPQNAEQGFVHFVVCDRKGEWVIVDVQNSHQPDYQSVGIISRDRCDQLLVKRLEGYLK